MVEWNVRDVHKGEEAARREIVQAATQELRSTYRPRVSGVTCGGVPTGILVALKERVVVGTVEYFRKEHHIYVQGVAVRQEYRGIGVCRALLLGIEKIAIAESLPALALSAIEETGNVDIFTNLGFNIVKRTIALNHVSPSGDPVTQVDMERKVA